jgi:hypothetical protein
MIDLVVLISIGGFFVGMFIAMICMTLVSLFDCDGAMWMMKVAIPLMVLSWIVGACIAFGALAKGAF